MRRLFKLRSLILLVSDMTVLSLIVVFAYALRTGLLQPLFHVQLQPLS